jgi:tRNA G18 (ribose-2'-O)-methylase SpoU
MESNNTTNDLNFERALSIEPVVKGRKLKRMQKAFLKEKLLNSQAAPGVHECVMVLDHLKPDFNVGKIFRSADAFGVKEIFLVGIPLFSPGPAMGSFRHVPARFFTTFEECYKELSARGYSVYVFEPEGGRQIYEAAFPKKSAFVLGHEEFGMSFKKEDFPELQVLTVPQFGKVQSLNVSIAASIAMYEYVRQARGF